MKISSLDRRSISIIPGTGQLIKLGFQGQGREVIAPVLSVLTLFLSSPLSPMPSLLPLSLFSVPSPFPILSLHQHQVQPTFLFPILPFPFSLLSSLTASFQLFFYTPLLIDSLSPSIPSQLPFYLISTPLLLLRSNAPPLPPPRQEIGPRVLPSAARQMPGLPLIERDRLSFVASFPVEFCRRGRFVWRAPRSRAFFGDRDLCWYLPAVIASDGINLI